jgi:hypothetical protein
MHKFLIIIYLFASLAACFGQVSGEIDLATAPASFVGENAGDKAGYHMSIAGDVNNDGFDDILIAAPFYDSNVDIQNNGKVYLLYGKAQGWGQNINLGDADASFLGEGPNNQASHDVFGIGDVNGDGIDDFAIGVKFANDGGIRAGKVYVFFGRTQGWIPNTSCAAADVKLIGEGPTSEAAHVNGLGDVNGDGIDDIGIGAGFNDQVGDNAGKVYVIFGRHDADWPAQMSMADADASYLGEMAGDWAGHRIAGAGDVNNDGLDDILIGASNRDQDGVADRGICYLIFGKRNGWTVNVSLANADASFLGPSLKTANLGWTVAGPGDVNGDHIDDLLIGAAGKSLVYIIFGKATGWQRNTLIEAEANVTLTSVNAQDFAGADLRSAGDVNNDGINDIIIGAYGNDQVAVNAGKAYLLYGRTEWPTTMPLASAEAIFTGEKTEDLAGFSVAGGGDVNHDGSDDVLIAACENDQNGLNAGKIYMFFPSTPALTLYAPNGGEKSEIGKPFNINWFSTAPQGNVSIEISRNNGMSWELIKNAPDNGSTQWQVTGPESDACLIRVTQLATGEKDVSDAPFRIIESRITVITPNGGEVWQLGEFHDITWSATDNISDVKIEFSTDAGSTYNVIETSTPNDGSYSWGIPAFNSSKCLVRVSDAADGTPWDVSNAFFQLSDGSGPSLTLLQPNGGELWVAGTDETIQWESRDIPSKVKLEYSPDGGDHWHLINTNLTNNGTFEWTVPDTSSITCLVRIATTANEYSDISDDYFTIERPPVQVMRIEAEHMSLDPVFQKQRRATASNDTVIALPRGTSFGLATYKFDNRPNGDYDLWIRYVDEVDGTGTTTIKINENQVDSWMWNTATEQDTWVKRHLGTFHFSHGDKIQLNLHRDRGEYARTDCILFVPAGMPTDQNLTVVSPNGGEYWIVGDPVNITWESNNTSGKVKIELSRNNGLNWETLSASEPDDGHFAWTVTSPTSRNCRVRVSDVDGNPIDRSDAVFEIADRPELVVTSPVGGEDWRVETVQQITWRSINTSGAVKIEISRNNGMTWQTLANNTPDDGLFDWSVTGPQSNQCLVRIADVDGTPAGVSNSTFLISVNPAIIILVPEGGENWAVGSDAEIRWASTNTSGYVNVEISRDGGLNWTPILNNIIDGGRCTWRVTDPPSNSCMIKVSDADGSPVATSAGLFTILRVPTMAVTSPNGGELWYEGTAHDLTWTSSYTSGTVQIDISRNNGATWSNIVASTEDDGLFNWMVTGPPAAGCRIRIRDAVSGAQDQSDASFNIIPRPSIRVDAPNGGERWHIGQVEQIRWTTTNGTGQVRIEISRNNGATWQVIAANVQDNGIYAWTVLGPVSEVCLIKVTDISGLGQNVSDAPFEIGIALSFTVLAPNGGETWHIGSTHDIMWTSVDGQDVNIQISRDGGTTWELLARTTDSGKYPWQVTAPATQNALIMVSNLDGNVFDTSNTTFVIQEPPVIVVTAPNGGERWRIGSQQNIRWTSANTSGSVNISLSMDNGVNWIPLISNTPDNGSFSWTVTGSASSLCLIRIADVNEEVQDVCDATFEIAPALSYTVVSPNGGEIWYIGSGHDITWNSVDGEEVNIHLSRNGGTEWELLATTADSGHYSWQVTGPASSNALIRVGNVAGTVFDSSDRIFSIQEPPEITVVRPNGGERWQIGSQQGIVWTSENTSGNVDIFLSRDNSTTWTPLASNTPDDGAYTWTVMGPASASCVIKVMDVNGGVMDVSDGLFEISVRPEITIFAPNGNEDWRMESQQEIRWQALNISGQVSIYLTRDNGANWEPIVNNTPNTGSYTWIVTGPSSDKCYMQVIDNVSGATDRSDGMFTISEKPRIIITWPNGGEACEIGKQYAVTWLSVNIGSVLKIQLSKNNGGTWESLTDNAANSGSFVWTAYEPKSDRCLVKISDPVTGASDVSDAVFAINYGTGVLSIQDSPKEFRLMQNYPNPFNPSTRITFQCPRRTDVNIYISNINGQRARTLVTGTFDTGTHSITWDGRDDYGRLLPSGIYFFTFETTYYKQTNRMLFMK